MKKFLAGFGLCLVIAFVAMYFSSDYYRAWIEHPLIMWDCKVKKEMPDLICLGRVAVNEASDDVEDAMNDVLDGLKQD